MTDSRQAAYEAIDSERDYQDSLWPGHTDVANPLTIGEFLLLIDQYVHFARDQWVVESKPELETLHDIRKIAGIAVNCMEQHGAPKRTTPKN